MSAIQQMMMAKGSVVSFTYATWNPADKDSTITLSGGNLTSAGSANGAVRSTISKSSGKWYWENTFTSTGGMSTGICFSTDTLTLFPGIPANSWGYINNGSIQNNATFINAAATYTNGDVIGIALDLDGLTLKCYKNNTLQVNETIPSGTYFAVIGYSSTATTNFGASTFVYTPPAGYNSGLYT